MHPDLVLLDLRLPGDVVQAIAAIQQACPTTRVLVYTVHADPEHLTQVQQADAVGYLLKEASQQEIVTAIRKILQGEDLF